MTGGGDIIKKGMDKVNDAKSMAGDTISAVVGDGDSDPTMNRIQFKPKDYRVSLSDSCVVIFLDNSRCEAVDDRTAYL